MGRRGRRGAQQALLVASLGALQGLWEGPQMAVHGSAPSQDVTFLVGNAVY